MIFAPHDVLTLSHPLSLASIHLLFLGVISMGMIGALFQMQSVLVGKPIPQPQGSSPIMSNIIPQKRLKITFWLFSAKRLYHHTLEHGTKFTFQS